MERLAIMGGTFDPIHMGHLRMARAVQRQMDFDKVVFLPSYIPPHKQTRSNCASWQDRLAMVELAIQEYDDFVVSCLEFDRGGISYTYDTIKFMQKLWPGAEIYLIIGEDALIHLYKWYRVPDLLRLVHFVAGSVAAGTFCGGETVRLRRGGRRSTAGKGLRPLGSRKSHPRGSAGNNNLLHRNPATAAGRKTHPGHGVPGSGKVYL